MDNSFLQACLQFRGKHYILGVGFPFSVNFLPLPEFSKQHLSGFLWVHCSTSSFWLQCSQCHRSVSKADDFVVFIFGIENGAEEIRTEIESFLEQASVKK